MIQITNPIHLELFLFFGQRLCTYTIKQQGDQTCKLKANYVERKNEGEKKDSSLFTIRISKNNIWVMDCFIHFLGNQLVLIILNIPVLCLTLTHQFDLQ